MQCVSNPRWCNQSLVVLIKKKEITSVHLTKQFRLCGGSFMLPVTGYLMFSCIGSTRHADGGEVSWLDTGLEFRSSGFFSDNQNFYHKSITRYHGETANPPITKEPTGYRPLWDIVGLMAVTWYMYRFRALYIMWPYAHSRVSMLVVEGLVLIWRQGIYVYQKGPV